jgi:hypothetical protein
VAVFGPMIARLRCRRDQMGTDVEAVMEEKSLSRSGGTEALHLSLSSAHRGSDIVRSVARIARLQAGARPIASDPFVQAVTGMPNPKGLIVSPS